MARRREKCLGPHLADRICVDGAVRQEWLLQDRAAIVAQLGLDVRDFAFNLATMRQQLGWNLCLLRRWTPAGRAGPRATTWKGRWPGR
ncbi:hypothetical protein ACVXG7_13740 [Enterobacter hormaechei]